MTKEYEVWTNDNGSAEFYDVVSEHELAAIARKHQIRSREYDPETGRPVPGSTWRFH